MRNGYPLAMGLVVSLSASASLATTYTSNVPMRLPGYLFQWGPSVDAHPSIIEVSDAEDTIVDVNVSLHGFRHSYPSDMSFMLVSPSDTKVIFYGGVGGNAHEPGRVDLTFDDEAENSAPSHWFGPDGHYTYRPTAVFWVGFGVPTDWPYPATNPPPGSYHFTLSSMDGTAANGQWELYTYDMASDDGGHIDGWSIDLVSANIPEPMMLFAPMGLVLLCRRR